MNIKDIKTKITEAIKENEKMYRDEELTLFDAVDKCYDDVIRVSKGNAFIFAEDDYDDDGVFKDDIIHRLGETLINKTITIKDFIRVEIMGICLYIVITKEKYVLK